MNPHEERYMMLMGKLGSGQMTEEERWEFCRLMNQLEGGHQVIVKTISIRENNENNKQK